MCWFTKYRRNVGIASISMLFLLTCLALLPLSAVSAHKVLPIGKDKRLIMLHEVLVDVDQKQEAW
jgi:hypothetical protein